MKKAFFTIMLLFLMFIPNISHADVYGPPRWHPDAVNLVIYQRLFNYISQSFTGLTANIPIPCSHICSGGSCGDCGQCTSYTDPMNLQLTIPAQYNGQPNLNLSWQGSTQSLLVTVNEIHGYIPQGTGDAETTLNLCVWPLPSCPLCAGFCSTTLDDINVDANNVTLNIQPQITGDYLKFKTIGNPSITFNNVTVGNISSNSGSILCQAGGAVANLFYQLLQPIIQSLIDTVITQYVNSQLLPSISGMINNVNVNLYMHGSFTPIAYQVRPSFFNQALNITANAAQINLDAGIGSAIGSVDCPPTPLAPKPPDDATPPTIDTGRTDSMLAFGVSQDVINDALYAVYQSGMMCITAPPLPVGLLKTIIPQLPSSGSLILKIIPTQAPTITLGSPQNLWDTVNLNGLIIEGLLGVDEAQTYPGANEPYNTQYTDAFIMSTDLSIRAEVYIDHNKLDQNGNPMLVVAIDSSPQGMQINNTVLSSELTNPSNINNVIKLAMSLASGFIGTALPAMSSAFTFSGVTILVKDIIPSGGYVNVYIDLSGFMNLLSSTSLAPPQMATLTYNNPSTANLKTLSLADNVQPLINTNSDIAFNLANTLPPHSRLSWRLSDQSIFGDVWQGWSLWTTDTTIKLDNLMDGEHTLEVRLMDSRTGITSTSTYTSFKVDTVKPGLKLISANYPTFVFNMSDPVTMPRLMYAVDNPASFTKLGYNENTVDLTNSTAGTHTLYVKAIDEAGNTSSMESIPYTVTGKTSGGCGTVPFDDNNPYTLLVILIPLFLIFIIRL